MLSCRSLILSCSYLLAYSLLPSTTAASEHSEQICSKIRQCVLSDAVEGGISDQMKDIVEQMIDSQCATMAARYDRQFEEAGLQQKSHACVDSFVDQGCEEVVATRGTPDTQACNDFEQAASDAGIELN